MLADMDWQEPVTLAVVAAVCGLGLITALRRRSARTSIEFGCHGCCPAGPLQKGRWVGAPGRRRQEPAVKITLK
jgi:hypothetical protein